MPVLVAICGKKRHGKGTLKDYLIGCWQKRFPDWPVYGLSFAGPLKQGCQPMFGFSDAQVYGDSKEDLDPFWQVKPREMLQEIGTDIFRDYLPTKYPQLHSFWIRRLQRELYQIPHQSLIIIDDCRFPNEFTMLRDLGAIMLRVVRPALMITPQSGSEHPSETALDDLTRFKPDHLFENHALPQFKQDAEEWFTAQNLPVVSLQDTFGIET